MTTDPRVAENLKFRRERDEAIAIANEQVTAHDKALDRLESVVRTLEAANVDIERLTARESALRSALAALVEAVDALLPGQRTDIAVMSGARFRGRLAAAREVLGAEE